MQNVVPDLSTKLQQLRLSFIKTSCSRSSGVQRLVYISCDAKAAMQNFMNLGQLPSNVYQGDPFIPKRVIPVDLFPHTPHFELVIYFERFPVMKLAAEQQ